MTDPDDLDIKLAVAMLDDADALDDFHTRALPDGDADWADMAEDGF